MKKQTIRDRVHAVVSANTLVTGKDVLAKLKKKYPKESFNGGTVLATFSNVRSELGLSRKKPRKAKTAGTDPLHAAHKFVQAVGDPVTAIDAVRQLMKLQVH